MPTRMTAHSLQERTQCLRVGDTVFLPRIELTDAEQFTCANWLRESVPAQQLFPHAFRAGVQQMSPFMLFEALQLAFLDHLETTRALPLWFLDLPEPLRRKLSIAQAHLGEQEDHHSIVLNFPFTGVSYIVLENGLVEQTLRTFGLYRLQDIRQLGYMHDPIGSADGPVSSLGTVFGHKRFNHVLDVSVLCHLMAMNNRLSPLLEHHLRVAALTHDALTPAGGDTTKMIDPDGFDEDLHYPELLANTNWKELRSTYRLHPRILASIVQGQGILGTLLDLADKFSYVARDTWHYTQRYGEDGPFLHDPEHISIREIVRQDPFICGLWDSVHVDWKHNRVVIHDVDRLGRFLRLRVLLFKQLYYHKASRYLEFLIVGVMLRFLYQNQTLTREILLQITDTDLDMKVGEAIGMHHALWSPRLIGEPHCEAFEHFEDASRRECELIAAGQSFCIIEDVRGKIKPSTMYLVRTDKGVMPFSEARPDETRELEKLAQLQEPFRLYALINPRVSPVCLEAVNRFRQAQLLTRR